MSEIIEKAVGKLNEKIGEGFEGSAKVVIEGEGAVMLDAAGARAGDGEADVTLTADADTFRALLDGELDPTAAFMSGRLSIEGEMSQAMKLGNALS